MNPFKQLNQLNNLDKDTNKARKEDRKKVTTLMMSCFKKVVTGKLRIDDVNNLKLETKKFYKMYPDKPNEQNAMLRIRQLETFCIDKKKFVKQNI